MLDTIRMIASRSSCGSHDARGPLSFASMRDFRIHVLVSFLIVGVAFLYIVSNAAKSDTLASDASATRPTTAPATFSADAIAAARRAMLNAIDHHIASLRALLDQIPVDQQGEISQRLREALVERAQIESASDAEIAARITARRRSVASKPKPATMNAPAPVVPALERDSATTKPAVSFLETQVVFPGSSSQGQINSVVRPTSGCELVTLRAPDGTRIVALFGRPSNFRAAVARPALLYFYGNGMCMAHSLYVFNGFRSLGFNVIMADYEGYGMSGGTPSEPGCYASADAAYNYLLTRDDVDHGRIVPIGWSLGAAVAIDLASRRQIEGLVTFSAFTNIADMSQSLLNGFPLGIMLLSSRFDNLAKISRVSCPILMAHGSLDPLVPPEMLDRLAKAARSRVTTFRVEGAEHNDIFQRGGASLFQRVKVFVDGLSAVSPTTRPQ